MIFSAAAILVLTALFSGIGLLFPGNPYRKEASLHHLLLNFWIGWGLAIAFLQFWHLFYKVSTLAMLALTLAGIAGWALAWRQMRTWKGSEALGLAGLAVIPALMLANHVMFVPPHWDHGLYHLQAVKWISNYAIVPGIGNLQQRLAFNNSNFLYAAALNNGLLAGRSYYVANTTLAFVIILLCANGFYQLFRGQKFQVSNLYYALMIPVVLKQMSTTHLPGYSPDIPIFLLQVLLAGELVRLAEMEAEREAVAREALFIVLLTAVGITVKLSFAAFGALILLATLAIWARKVRAGWQAHLRTGLGWAGLAAVLIVPWLGRHILLSGYLLYPSDLISLPVIWKVPEDLVAPVAPIITLWAQTASQQIGYDGSLQWLLRWWGYEPFIVRQAFVFSLLALLADVGFYGLAKWVWKRPVVFDWRAAGLVGISALSLVYWFEMAPDYRFSGAAFWILLVGALLLGFRLLISSQLVKNSLFLACALVLVTTIWLSPNQFSNNLSRKLLLLPPPETELAQAQNSASGLSKITNSGLQVWMPGDQTDQCWNLPLPCTTRNDFTPKLQLIDPNDPQKGFEILNW